MVKIFKKHPVAVILSVLFHLGLITFFIVGVDFFDDSLVAKPPVNIVKATVIDESKVRAEAEKLKKLERNKKRQEKQRRDKLKAERLKKESDLKKKQSNEKKKHEQLKVAEAARHAKLKKQKTEDAKKKAADKKKKATELKKKQAADKKKKVAAEKRKKAEDLKKQEQADRLSAMLEAANNEEQEQMAKKAISSYSNQIQARVSNSWIEPAFDFLHLKCEVRVRLYPDGGVIDAQVIKSSGNALFDLSVERATKRAAPFPVPTDPALFRKLREIEFTFNPSKR